MSALTSNNTNVNALADIAVALRGLASALEAIATAPTASAAGNERLTERQVLERYGLGRRALDTRGVPKVRHGRAYRWLASDVERALDAARPPAPARRTADAIDAGDDDPIATMIRRGDLRPRNATAA